MSSHSVHTSLSAAQDPQAPIGLVYGIAAYSCWGVMPLFFKLLKHLPPMFVLGQRMIWACLFFMVLVAWQGNLAQLKGVFGVSKTLGTLVISALLVATNWGVFIYAVTMNKVLESSLGYFIAPLIVVALGVVVLGERFRRMQVTAIALAAVGVAIMTISYGRLPWIGLALALTFGCYGLFRKTVRVEPVTGLCVETILLMPIGVVLAAVMWREGHASLHQPRDGALLLIAGPVTGIPLLLFTAAARRLRLATIGLLQYIGPLGQFALAVFVYHEPLGAGKLVGFCLIWAALVLYSSDSYFAFRDAQRASAVGVNLEPLPE